MSEEPTAVPIPQRKRRAIVSVTEKQGIVKACKRLIALGFEIISTGGTAELLIKSDVPVTTIAQMRARIFTEKMEARGWKMMLGIAEVDLETAFHDLFPTQALFHRVASLHAEVHGGILAATRMLDELKLLGYDEIDLLCVDFYDFELAVAEAGITFEQALEKIDIGGPAMVTGGSKNLRIVISHPAEREEILQKLEQNGDLTLDERRHYAANSFARVARYRLKIAEYVSGGRITGVVLEKFKQLPYGENQNQSPAWLAREFDSEKLPAHRMDPLGITEFKPVHGGMDPSFNNWTDVSRMLHLLPRLVKNLKNNFGGHDAHSAAVVVKHGNPCGIGVHITPIEALKRMIDGDLIAIHGGLAMLPFPIHKEEAEVLMYYGMPEPAEGKAPKKRLLDGIYAPHFSDEAKEILRRSGENKLRLVENPALAQINEHSMDTAQRFVQLRGAWLIQPPYGNSLNFKDTKSWEFYYMPQLSPQRLVDACISHAASHASNGNAIAIANGGKLVGLGAGQQDRVTAFWLALYRAKSRGHSVEDGTGSSNSFFPYADAFQLAVDARLGLVISTSGSVTGDPAIQKLIRTLHKTGGKCPGYAVIPDSEGRGFSFHVG